MLGAAFLDAHLETRCRSTTEEIRSYPDIDHSLHNSVFNSLNTVKTELRMDAIVIVFVSCGRYK